MSTPPDFERTNMLWAWALFGLFVLLFAGVVGVAFIYNSLLGS